MSTVGKEVVELYDISEKRIRKNILRLIIPIVLEGLLQMLAGFITMAMTGKLDATAIGALGLSVRITQIIWAFFKGVSIGATVFVAQAYGGNNNKELREIIIQSLISSLVIIFIIQQLIFWFAPSIVKTIFGGEGSLLEITVMHLRWVSFGLPFLVIVLVGGGVLQAMGDALTPLIIAIVMNIVNVIFCYGFIFGNLGMSNLGIKGAALALVIAQIVSAGLYIYFFFRKKGILRKVELSKVRFNMKKIKEIYKVSLPSSMEAVFLQVAIIIITNVVLSYGENHLAAYQLAIQGEGMFFTPAMGFGVAATTFIGQSLGSGNKKLAKGYMKEICIETIVATGFSTICLILFPRFIMGLLTDKIELIEIGVIYLIVTGFIQIPQNLGNVLVGALRGAGYSKVPVIVSSIGIWGIRVLGAILFGLLLKVDIIWIWIAIDFDLLVRLIISVAMFKKKNIYENAIILTEET